ncbi:MAG: thioredoxin domain-containing protein, partial [Candidatus Omnitrophica bacterium]|nr:thioredoxin domain-containing protein [Candidatus Omnitrophota bacterium]
MVVGSINIMTKISKKFAAALIVIICVVVVFTTKFLIQRFRGSRPSESIAKIKGDDNAPIRVTEFIDFQCPACAQGAAYLKEMIEKYPKAIRLELKHYPLPMHRHGLSSSRYAECAAQQGKFWLFQDLLLARQSNWHRLFDADPAFEKIADDIHLDKRDLKVCLKDDTVDETIKKNMKEGIVLGI